MKFSHVLFDNNINSSIIDVLGGLRVQEAQKSNSHIVHDLRQLKYLSEASQSVSVSLSLSLSLSLSVCL